MPESPRAISSEISANVAISLAFVELHAAVFLRNAERADADCVGADEDRAGQPLAGRHRPFQLPVGLDERQDHVVDELPAALAHHALLV